MTRQEHPLEVAFETEHREEEKLPKQKHATPAKPFTTEHQKLRSRVTGLDHEISFGPQPDGLVPKNPFASQAQQRYMYANPDVLGKKALKEWGSKTDFKKLPKKKGK